jgi:hypothetical protein
MMRKILLLGLMAAALGAMSAPVSAQAFNFADEAGFLIGQADQTRLIFPSSLENEASFGLFFNSYDYMRTNPADFALLTGDESTRYLARPSERSGDPAVLYTNLANFGSMDTFQLGGFTEAGPGNFGAAVGYVDFSFEESGTGFPESDEADGSQVYLVYGWGLNDTMTLGVSLDYLDLESTSMDMNSFGSDAFGDELTSYEAKVALRGDPSSDFSWNVSGFFRSQEIESFERDVDSGGTDRERLDLDGSVFGVMGRLNWYRGDTDYELFGGYETGDFDVDNTELLFEGTPSSFIRWDRFDDTNDADRFTLGAKALHRLGDTDFAAGLVLQQVDLESNLGYRQFEPDSAPTDVAVLDVATVRVRDRYEAEQLTWSIPLSVRHHFTDKFSVVAGAIFSMMSVEETESDFVTALPSGSVLADVRREDEVDISDTDYRLGFRYEISRHLAAQLLFGEEESMFLSFDGIGGPGPAEFGLMRREEVETDIAALMVSLSF